MVRFRPGKLAYLSESDTEVEKEQIEPTKRCAALSKRGSPRTPALSNCQISEIRSSERVRRKQSQSFEKPTRQQLLSKIKTIKSPSKMLDRLKPRRLVNDFTKERHRYNYDPDYTSGESSIDNFIDDDEEESVSEESSLAEETPSLIPRPKSISYNDDDQTPTKGKESNVAKSKFTRIKVKEAKVTEESPSSSEDEQKNASESQVMKTRVSKGNLSDSSNDDIINSSTKTRVILSSSDVDSSGSDVIMPGQHRNPKRFRRERVDSGSLVPSSTDNCVIAPKHSSKRKLNLFCESSEASNANTDSEAKITSNSTVEESEEQEEDGDDSGSDVSESSSSHKMSSSGHFHSRRAELMQHKRDKKRRMFSKLIQTRKRKN